MKHTTAAWIFGSLTILIFIIVLGVGLYLLGTSVIVALVSDYALCCCIPIIIMGGLGFLLYVARGVFLAPPDV